MRKITFLLLILIVTHSYSTWIKSGNAELLGTSYSNFKNFVVTQDSRFIFTLDDKAVIKKFNLVTGDSISSFTIQPDLNKPRTANWAFLSEDAKTFCYAYNPYIANMDGFNACRICDINNGNTIYSVDVPFKGTDGDYITDFNNIYYDSENHVLITVVTYDVTPRLFYGSIHTGNISILKLNDTSFKLLRLIDGATKLLFTDSSNNKAYLNYLSSRSLRFIHDDVGYGGEENTSSIFSITDNKIELLKHYYYNTSIDGISQIGTNFNITSGFFSGNGTSLFLNEGNKIYIYDTKTDKNVSLYSLEELEKARPIIKDSPDSNLLYAIVDSSIHIYRSDKGFHCNNYNASALLKIIKNTYDNKYLIFINNKGDLFRIHHADLLKLKANFKLADSIAVQGDDFNLFNCSLGEPDSYHWYIDNKEISSDYDPIYSFTDTGYHNVKLVIQKGSVSDSIIRMQSVYVIPKIIPEFDFTIAQGISTFVQFNNKSIGKIDSILWDFGDGHVSKEFNPNHEYLYSGNYKVSLKVYSYNKFKMKFDSLVVKNTVLPINSEFFAYEISDTSRMYCEAFSGYEIKEKEIIYHIAGDSSNYFGRLNFLQKSWEVIHNNGKSFLTRTEDGLYTFVGNNTIYRYNMEGIEINNLPFREGNLMAVRSKRDTVILSMVQNGSFAALIFYPDNRNEQKYLYSIREYGGCSTGIYMYCKDSVYSYIVIGNENSMDYALSYTFYYLNKSNGRNETKDVVYINADSKKMLSKFSDFIRLNDEMVVLFDDGAIKYFRSFNKPMVPIDSNYLNFTLLYEVRLDSLNIKSLLKINPYQFIAVGSYKSNPAAFILNEKGEISDSFIIKERWGCFNYTSITYDNGLLFSGYRYIDYGRKSPYYVKLKENSNSVPTLSKLNVIDVQAYPNPTGKIITISFYLTDEAELSIKIFDIFGNLLNNTIRKVYPPGKSEVRFDLSEYSTGNYIFIIGMDDKAYPGKFMYLKP